jgi:mono/diheme cytochrome c family protein
MKLNTGFGSKCWRVGAGLLVSSLAFQAGVSSLATPAAKGAAVFKAVCVTCHRADGKASSYPKTPDFTDPKWQSSTKDRAMSEVIKNSKKDTAMPAFGSTLNDEQISTVIAYIRSLDSSKKK